MTVNREVKGTLAKLLATEDLIIEHRNCETAQFDVERRVLTLPIWDQATEAVYDMLVSHEVGHALYTPRSWDFKEVPQSFLNVVEDARIEKLMKRRYQGLPKTFFAGYKELSEQDFFEVQGNVTRFSLIDKINLQYKIGNFQFIPFTDEEQVFVDAVGECETFEDVEKVSRDIYEYMKEEFDHQEKADAEDNDSEFEMPDISSNPDLGDDSQDPFSEEPPIDADTDGQEESDDGTESEGGDLTQDVEDTDHIQEGGREGGDPLEAQTDKIFTDKVKDYVKHGGYETEYVEIDKVDPDKLIISWKEILEMSEERYQVQMPKYPDDGQLWRYNVEKADLDKSEQDYREFFKSSQKEVNYLVKEFECRKAASSYARSTTSRTGVLDTAKLHTYRYNEDLFKKVTNLPQGKNHGMIFLLDWSGSMSNCLFDTVKQVLQLTWFCQKVGIPYRVYAFSNSIYSNNYYDRTEDKFEEKLGKISFNQGFGLLEMLSSEGNKKDKDRSALALWRNAGVNSTQPKVWQRVYSMGCPAILGLSGTPLMEAIAAMHSVLPQFIKKTGAEKVSLSILTDGEAAQPTYNCKRSAIAGDNLFRNSFNGRCQLRDRKTGRVYARKDNPLEQTNIFIQNLKDSFRQVQMLGFRLITPRDTSGYFRMIQYMGFINEISDEAIKRFRKQKFYEVTESPYDKLFVMPTTNIVDDNPLDDLKEDATKAQVGAAFKKMFKNKASNKKMLASFAETVG
tara:strand:- start:7528 stop:9732 length:2205 start_codon:yes stop_codon:yes gene_type:complete